MEKTTKNRTRITEPGRRYNASVVRPRPGTDVLPPKKDHQASSPLSVESTNNRNVSTKSVPRNPHVKPAMQRTKRSMVLRRQMVERAKEQRIITHKKRSKSYFMYAGASFVVLSFMVIGWSFRDALPFGDKTAQSAPEKVNVISSAPTEASTLEEVQSTPDQINQRFVTADAPKTLRVPKLQVEAQILQVGTALSGEPIAPKNIYDVGWFETSSKPKVEGAVLLNGHIAGPSAKGIFSQLGSLKPDDQITIELGSGEIVSYIVVRIQEYSGGQIDMVAAINSVDPSRGGLNLVTTLNKFSGTTKRYVVFAVQQD